MKCDINHKNLWTKIEIKEEITPLLLTVSTGATDDGWRHLQPPELNRQLVTLL